MNGPCEWGLSYAECSDTAALDSLNDEDKANVESMAVEYLWLWTRRQFGLCDVSIRPCRQDCTSSSTFGQSSLGVPWQPALVAGKWHNITCGLCGDLCDCANRASSLRLPGPVQSVTQIVVDGAVLDPTAYRVDNRQMLVRTDGGAWPTCQDLSLPATEPGTWQVTYTQGVEVPQGGKIAAGMLAAEFAKALCNDSTCRLPQRVQSITRQGVTMAVLDSFEDLEKGRTGIWLIDSWVASVVGTEVPSRVYSVDIPRPRNRRMTWPSPSP